MNTLDEIGPIVLGGAGGAVSGDEGCPDLPDWLGEIGPDQLDDFVNLVDNLGGPSSPHFTKITLAFNYNPGVKVDQDIDPCSEKYCEQMISLYEEIAGRKLYQSEGELTPISLERHVDHVNPLASVDPHFVARHARAIIHSIMVANLPLEPKVLDLGCGWGISTELLNYCAADVTAVDISPDFVELVELRAQRHNRKVKTICAGFDDFVVSSKFDMAFFYECFHHAVKPWEVLERVADCVAPNGRIVFAGEPINELWWKHWGLRLDAISVYCIRKYGWFESGWSEAFLKRMFSDLGWELTLVPLLGLDNGQIGCAHRKSDTKVSPLAVPYPLSLPGTLEMEAEIRQLQAECKKLVEERSYVWKFLWKYSKRSFRKGIKKFALGAV